MRLYRYLKPFVFMAVAVLALVLLQSFADLSLPSLMATIVDDGIFKGNISLIWKVGRNMLLVAFGGALCSVIAGYLSAKVASGFGLSLRSAVFSHVESFSLREFDQFGTSSLITRTTNDVTQMQMVVLMSLRMVASAPMMIIGGIVMAVSQDARLSLYLVAVLPIIALAIAFTMTKTLPMFKAMQKKIDRLNQVLREGLTGVRVIRAFNRQEYEASRFNKANLDLTDTALRVNRLMAFLMPLMMFTFNLTSIAIIWIGGHRIDAGSLEIGHLMAFIQYAMQILMSLVMMSMIFVMLPRASASAQRINQVLDSNPDIVDPQESQVDDPEDKGTLEFKDVTFSYPGASTPVLRNISFKTKPGETVAILGGTGSGKSTLVNLIPRFYDVDSGQVLVGGVDVRSMAQRELRAKIGFVPQRAVLFHGTVEDNIRYGKFDASQEEIIHAAEIAQALDFVTAMKDGFQSEIAQGGQNVSGGQKQRLSIARALVRKPQLYVFDDSFSAVDFKTDAKLRQALRQETRDATTIIVAQRVSTIMDADRIIVLDKGTIAGMGTHGELMAASEVYREIVLSQLSEEEIA